jgi:hypothetical protein
MEDQKDFRVMVRWFLGFLMVCVVCLTVLIVTGHLTI